MQLHAPCTHPHACVLATEASAGGKRPRRHPRIGMDCWARTFVYHAIHRYPSRLDAMLAALTRRYLLRTPVRAGCCLGRPGSAGSRARGWELTDIR